MPQRSYLWTTRLCGVVLYSLVFVFTCHFWQVGPGPLRGQPELLLFMLPGIVMALVQVERPAMISMSIPKVRMQKSHFYAMLTTGSR